MRAVLALLLAVPLAAQVPPPGGPAAHRLLLTPTARTVPSGEARVGLTELAVPTAAVGVGRASLAAGVVAFPNEHVAGLLFVEPKATLLETDGLAVALGATARVDVVREAQASAVPFLVATATGERVAGTLGVGARVNVKRPPWIGHATDDVLYGPLGPDPGWPTGTPPGHEVWLVRSPAVFGGVEMRASPHVTVVMEAALLPQQSLRYTTGPICDPGPCTSEADDVDLYEHGPIHHDASIGTAVRVERGPAAFDVGFLMARDHDGWFRRVELAPWLSVTVGL